MEKKKIISNSINFIKSNGLRIITLLVSFQIFSSLKNLPYLNLITDFDSYAFLTVSILAYFFFSNYLNARKLVLIAIILTIVTVPFLIFHSEGVTSFLGFIIFSLLLGAVLLTIISERDIHV